MTAARASRWPAWLLLIGACCGTTASAQSTSAEATGIAPDGATVESEPLRCWLKTTKASFTPEGPTFDYEPVDTSLIKPRVRDYSSKH